MAKTAGANEKKAAGKLLAELAALPPNSPTGKKWLEYLRRLPKPHLPEGWTSADDIRAMRGPLPEERQEAVPEKQAERTPEDREAVKALLRDLEALPSDYMFTGEELLAFIRRMPPRQDDFTSADIIRELRGPLPEDDLEFQRNIRGRR